MPLTPYAVDDDLDTWVPELVESFPDNRAQVLRSACLLVAQALNESLYDPTVVIDDARRDASCAQAAAWIASSLDPTAGEAGIAGKAKSKSVNGVTLTYDIPTAADRAGALKLLCGDAYNILYSASLIWVPLPIWSETPDQGLFVNEFGVVGGNSGFTGTGLSF